MSTRPVGPQAWHQKLLLSTRPVGPRARHQKLLRTHYKIFYYLLYLTKQLLF